MWTDEFESVLKAFSAGARGLDYDTFCQRLSLPRNYASTQQWQQFSLLTDQLRSVRRLLAGLKAVNVDQLLSGVSPRVLVTQHDEPYPFTREEVLALDATDEPFYVTLTRLVAERDADMQPRPEFEGLTQLIIQRAQLRRSTLPVLTLIVPHTKEWAEGSYLDVQADGAIVVEDYCMRLYHRAVTP